MFSLPFLNFHVKWIENHRLYGVTLSLPVNPGSRFGSFIPVISSMATINNPTANSKDTVKDPLRV